MPGINLQDRRRYKRRNLIYYVPVIESDTHHPIGRMADVSSKGFKLDSENEIPLGKDFQLGLNTTPDIADVSFIAFVARSRWCEADKIEPCQYYAGFDIVDIDPQAARVVQSIVDKYGANDTPIL
jgi:hypothetical protein